MLVHAGPVVRWGGRKLCNSYHPVKTRVTGGYIWTRFQQGHGGGQGNPAISITRLKPGWPVDIYERAFNKDTVGGKETRQYLSPGENRVTRGYTWTRFREVHSCYQGKKKETIGHYCLLPGENQGDPLMDIDALSLIEWAFCSSVIIVWKRLFGSWFCWLCKTRCCLRRFPGVVAAAIEALLGFYRRVLYARDVITTTRMDSHWQNK